MNPKNATASIIIISLVFAVAMVIASNIFVDSEHSQTITYILIALWFVPFGYFISLKSKKSE